MKLSRSYLHPWAKDFLIVVNLPSCRKNSTWAQIVKMKFIVTCTIDAISPKSILAATIVGSLSVIADCMEATVVCFDGTLVDI